MGLRKKDINFRERKIYIQNNLIQACSTILQKELKNGKNRVITINRKLTRKLKKFTSNTQENNLLFNIQPNVVTNIFIETIKKYNLKNIALKDLRHLHASFLLKENKNTANIILLVSQRLRT